MVAELTGRNSLLGMNAESQHAVEAPCRNDDRMVARGQRQLR